jgi:hypothetical protein
MKARRHLMGGELGDGPVENGTAGQRGHGKVRLMPCRASPLAGHTSQAALGGAGDQVD